MFEKATWIRLPRHVTVGHDVLDGIGDVVADLGVGPSAVIVTTPSPNAIVGDRVAAGLGDAGLGSSVVEVEAATAETLDAVVGDAEAAGADVLVGLGGGTAIDLAKMAADRMGLGFISVPTAASHDGIVSGRGSLPEGDTRHSVAAEPPLAVIADTAVLADAPWELTTAGCADIISNYTAVKDWRLANRLQGVEYSEYSAALSEMTAEMLVDNADAIRPGLEESAWIVVKALVSSGVAMSIAGSSRPASGAEHLFSHRLDRLAPEPALHGHQVGVGAIMAEYLHDGDAGRWRSIRDALADIGAPTTADGLGVEPDVIVAALTSAHEIRDRFTILGTGMSEPAAREVAVRTGVI